MNNKKNITIDIGILKKQIVTDTLIKAGVKISDKGFYILRDIILFYADSKCPIDVKQKEVIIFVGRKYSLTFPKTYRYIAILINNAMNFADPCFLHDYFGVCYRPETGTIKPKAFILRIVDDVKMQYEVLEKGGVVNE